MAGPYKTPHLYDTPLPDLITLVARRDPKRLWMQIIREHPDLPTDSIRLTWSEVIQHAQNAAADLQIRWAEDQQNGAKPDIRQPREPGSDPVVVGVLGNNGYELYINVLGCLLNRWTILLISPKNSPAAIEHLLRTSKSSLFLVEPTNLEFGRKMEQALCDLTALRFATLDPPATGPASSPLAPSTPDQLKREMDIPAFYMHTSGSTGHPKIVLWSHEFVLSGIRTRLDDPSDWVGRPFYCMTPLIHSIGIIVYFMYGLAHGNLLNFISSPTPKPPSAAALVAHMPFLQGAVVLLAPSILEDLHSLGSEAEKTVINGARFIFYGGAPLGLATGNALAEAGMKFTSAYGTTEINMGTTQVETKHPNDWQYMYFRAGYTNHFLPVDDHSKLCELIVGPGPDGHPAVLNHESPRGYATNDVWEPHPTVPDLWRHHSRKGDVTVLSNGEKTDNKQLEDLLRRDKRILHVQVFGAGRPLNGVLLQPADTSLPPQAFLAAIAPTLAHANTILPAHSRLVPELVLITPPDRPFATTDKGTVKKKETLDRFVQDIDAAYEALEQGGASGWVFEGQVVEENVRMFLRSAVRSVLGEAVPDDADLFDHGFDSLLALRLRTALLSIIHKTETATLPVSRNIVYTEPSINALTAYVLTRARPGDAKRRDVTERIRRSIARYSANFTRHTGSGLGVPSDKVVALSGSTGSLGTSILARLLERTDVKRVFLLNRAGSTSQKVRQVRALEERGLDPQVLDDNAGRIVYLDVDFSRKDLGLAHDTYEDLRVNATHILHAAWHLNFNFVLESYERVHVAGVRHLADLALASPHVQPPRFVFFSTIAAAGLYRGPTEEPLLGERGGQVLVPEMPLDDPGIALEQGYGQSKYVGERVLVEAVEAGLRVTVVRIGQLSGVTTTGAWAPSEHVPIMLRSSLALGIVPEDLEAVRWVPSDVAASAIIKQAFEDTSPLGYFSIENPFPTLWDVVVQALSAMSPTPLRHVTLAAWLEHIRSSNPDPEAVPAAKLLDFYQSMGEAGPSTAALGWENSVRIAPELALGPINVDLVKKYIVYQQGKATAL